MEKLGNAWRKAIESIPAIRDEISNHSVLLQDMHKRETLADSTLRPLMSGEISAGIASCIKRGSGSLAFDVPDGIEGTVSYEAFRAWAKKESITAHIMHPRGQKRSMLVLSPWAV